MLLKKIKHKLDYYNAPITIFLTVIGLVLTFYSTFYSPKPSEVKEQKSTVADPTTDSQNEKTEEKGIKQFLSVNEKAVLYSLSGVFFIISGVLFFKLKRKKKLKNAVFNEDGRFFRSIKDLMAEALSKNEILISSIKFTDITTVNDLKSICTKIFYPNRNSAAIEEAITDARKKAYSIKYSTPREDDEKIIGEEDFGNWVVFFKQLLDDLNIDNFQKLQIVDVGIGNANTYNSFFRDIKKYVGVDISSAALTYAKKKIPTIQVVENEAENLSDIPNAFTDIYISFRTFQSTLFDRRKALHEARRIIKPGGYIIISLPILYYTKRDKFIKGLSDSSKNISMDYAYFLSNSIKKYLEMLNFSDVQINDKSPYEIYITGQLEE